MRAFGSSQNRLQKSSTLLLKTDAKSEDMVDECSIALSRRKDSQSYTLKRITMQSDSINTADFQLSLLDIRIQGLSDLLTDGGVCPMCLFERRCEMNLEQTQAFLEAQFPDIHVDRISILGEGWDSIAALVNDSIVFRIPKRPEVSRRMANEMQVLKTIRPYITSPIPKIEWVGPALGDFPVSGMGYRKLVGSPLSEIPSGPTKDHILEHLGHFLTELHEIPASAFNNADVPWFRWTGDMRLSGADSWEKGLRGFTDRILADVVPLLNRDIGTRVVEKIEVFLSNPTNLEFQPVLIHGDLAPEHVMVHKGEIGIIDFGDCGLGDPAYDVWPELMPWYHGSIDASFETRQYFYRWLVPFHSVLYGLTVDDQGLIEEALQTLQRKSIEWY